MLRLVAASPEPGDIAAGGGFDVEPVDFAKRYPLSVADCEAPK